jgi:hypothetical protein
MNISKSLDRLKWRFSKPEAFTPNLNDVEAYNELATYCEMKMKQTLIDNQLFGKMYIYLFGRFCIYYKTDHADPIVQKELHKLLDKDLRILVQEFVEERNAFDLERHIDAGFPLSKFRPMDYNEAAEHFRILVNASIDTFCGLKELS